jgi:hypothetical protein
MRMLHRTATYSVEVDDLISYLHVMSLFESLLYRKPLMMHQRRSVLFNACAVRVAPGVRNPFSAMSTRRVIQIQRRTSRLYCR